MNLSKDSWHAKLFKMAYTKSYCVDLPWHHDDYETAEPVHDTVYPNDFCSYFWKLVFSVLLFPIYWLGCFKHWMGKRYFNNGFYEKIKFTLATYFGIIVAELMGFLTMVATFSAIYGGVAVEHEIWLAIFGIPYLVVVCLVIAAVIAAVIKIGNVIEDKYHGVHLTEEERQRKKENSVFTLAKTKAKSFKENNCPIVNWTE